MNSIKVRFFIEKPEPYLNDVQDIPRAFSPYLIVDNEAQGFLSVHCSYNLGRFKAVIKSSFTMEQTKEISVQNTDILQYKKITKHFLKIFIYDHISSFLNVLLPYGSLTGVRPTKLYYDILGNHKDAKGILINEYKVREDKAELIKLVVEGQKGIYKIDNNNCDIFVNIPFCPTRCNYCSFISNEVSKVKNLLPEYVIKVRNELEKIKYTISERKLSVRSIYVGGGTPTCIGTENLYNILYPLKDYGVEFTVEGGRPDTITEEILQIMKQCNVNRISVNPQSFNQKTLIEIGRAHTIEQIYNAYYLSKQYGFDVNMDLIAQLQGESVEEFCYSVNKAIELAPDNITIHTLSIKRGATIRDKEKESFGKASEMVSYAHQALQSSDYKPYYMYRQKNMADNLENTGYCLKNKACIYNIDMMEDISTIFGAGAGAMSKLYADNKIERVSNPKGIREYLTRK